MTQDVSGVGAGGAGTGNGPPTTSTMTDESSTTSTLPTSPTEAKETAKEVASTTKDQAGQVAHEVKAQARNLTHEAKTSVNARTTEQRDKAVEGLRSLSDELDRMSAGEGTTSNGTASEVVRQVSGKTRELSDFLEQRDPGEILDEVRRFARQRPGLFLAICAGAGVVAGRVTRSAVAEATSDDDSTSPNGRRSFSATDTDPYGGNPGLGGASGATFGTTAVRRPPTYSPVTDDAPGLERDRGYDAPGDDLPVDPLNPTGTPGTAYAPGGITGGGERLDPGDDQPRAMP